MFWALFNTVVQVRDEHRQDYDPGRGGWGAQAQRIEMERRREVEERYHDAQDVPGAVAGGGGDWKAEHVQESSTLKRGRSPEDEGASGRGVGVDSFSSTLALTPTGSRSLARVSRNRSTTPTECRSPLSLVPHISGYLRCISASISLCML